jgi:hypothetical protein
VRIGSEWILGRLAEGRVEWIELGQHRDWWRECSGATELVSSSYGWLHN